MMLEMVRPDLSAPCQLRADMVHPYQAAASA